MLRSLKYLANFVPSSQGIVSSDIDLAQFFLWLSVRSPPANHKSPNGWNKIEGTITFALSSTAIYRYALSLDGVEKFHIWIKDCQNKRQWDTEKMLRKELVTLANTISDCEVTDYAEVCLRLA
ncbi:uncharacterized protein IUM83_01967 [Phytophthora cinnamomi]|uniref:uncharacterized protein n=1 Tax=Phytophthora cinnamomi TaxID=4785 RepID=UPI00355990A6|nr:hypothetical protein IUM83_01967 [Phytophthora cinnamomi]